ncbi:hypothetical protein L5515_016431 [Caenorhabditis briggsae]|uniref:Uncharacterized protein n=1 Tax=Caenorhabditis briggsae TaxID=6238 RepID=A0AAE9FB54_CAEBR|nr:hypothetical protein L5515_016431 [Caenorhabditis briggsae]
MIVIDEKPEEEEKEEKEGEMRSESDGEVAVAAKRWTRKTDKDDLQQPICHGWLIVCGSILQSISMIRSVIKTK